MNRRACSDSEICLETTIMAAASCGEMTFRSVGEAPESLMSAAMFDEINSLQIAASTQALRDHHAE